MTNFKEENIYNGERPLFNTSYNVIGDKIYDIYVNDDKTGSITTHVEIEYDDNGICGVNILKDDVRFCREYRVKSHSPRFKDDLVVRGIYLCLWVDHETKKVHLANTNSVMMIVDIEYCDNSIAHVYSDKFESYTEVLDTNVALFYKYKSQINNYIFVKDSTSEDSWDKIQDLTSVQCSNTIFTYDYLYKSEINIHDDLFRNATCVPRDIMELTTTDLDTQLEFTYATHHMNRAIYVGLAAYNDNSIVYCRPVFISVGNIGPVPGRIIMAFNQFGKLDYFRIGNYECGLPIENFKLAIEDDY